MPTTEFTLIERYFRDTGPAQQTTTLSQGDDAAVIAVPAGFQLVMSIDTLIEGVHFPSNTAAANIAHKALAANLSDLAAMAATPAWFLLTVSFPDTNQTWLAEFSQSLKKMAQDYQIELIGGDTCQGPLSITIQINGLVRKDRYLTRSGAQIGDLVVVSGQLGNAALGLAEIQDKIKLPKALKSKCIDALNKPVPRICLIDFLQLYATAAIDISDGLVGDLRHILDKSKVGAVVQKADLPVNQWIKENQAYEYVLYGGDDYELCFTLPKEHKDKLSDWNHRNKDCPLSIIGEVTESNYYLSVNQDVTDLSSTRSYQHFDH